MLGRRTWWTLTVALPLLALPRIATPARAVEPPAATAALSREGVHIVRPGDTLEQLAEIYLGAARRWPELARLNPGIGDPKRLPPGLRLRILPASGSTFAAAQIASLSNRVHERPAPIPWSEAKQGDFLVDQDGVRTYSKSSAEMHFGDGTRLTLTEDSLVFLRRSGDRLQGVPGKSVEIVEGQAEVASAPGSARPQGHRPEIEIVLGNARATSRPNRDGGARARARRPSEGGSKVMVYGGEGEVEAGGAKVAVAEGMGTSVGK
ncbi:MAG TPA: LysM peptidoglycan-binding domain-containing protein, partial [Thermoanaerobaculia bacterium]|nr:LysM peptidoglycan-binding domain-containing protein [Thermoanaerobaculia bacterium]